MRTLLIAKHGAQQQLRRIFADRNESILAASDGLSGFREGIAQAPELVLVDESLRDPNFIELVRKFRSHPRTRDTPTVVFSPLDQESLELLADGSGAAAAISLKGGYEQFVDLAIKIVDDFRAKIARLDATTIDALCHLKNSRNCSLSLFDTFVSWSHKDMLRARSLHARLISEKLIPAMDISTFRAGEEWWAGAKSQINQSATVTLLASVSSAESEQVRREIDYALAMNIPILPVQLDDLPRDAFGRVVRDLHWLDARLR